MKLVKNKHSTIPTIIIYKEDELYNELPKIGIDWKKTHGMLLKIKNNECIIIDGEIVNKLGQPAQDAIIYHEIGHLKNGDDEKKADKWAIAQLEKEGKHRAVKLLKIKRIPLTEKEMKKQPIKERAERVIIHKARAKDNEGEYEVIYNNQHKDSVTASTYQKGSNFRNPTNIKEIDPEAIVKKGGISKFLEWLKNVAKIEYRNLPRRDFEQILAAIKGDIEECKKRKNEQQVRKIVRGMIKEILTEKNK